MLTWLHKVAELAHEATLTHDQIIHLIQLVQCSRTGDFTLQNYTNIWNTWEAVSHHLTPVSNVYIALTHNLIPPVWKWYYCGTAQLHRPRIYGLLLPLWDWVVDILWHPVIGPHCIFDAQWLSKFEGQTFIRFIDEPWTADVFCEC